MTTPAPPRAASLLTRFAQDRRGVVAMIFAVSLVPLLLAVGAAVDYAMYSRMRSKLQIALDGTALAAARHATAVPSAKAKDIEAFAERYFRQAILPEQGRLERVEFERGRARMRFEASAVYPTRFMGLAALATVGTREMRAEAAASVDRGVGVLEVALVLDNTGSMATNNRIGRLREAATLLVNILEGARSDERDIRIALVPFVTAVNVRGEGFRWDWIDRNAAAPFHGQNLDPNPDGTRANHLTLFSRLRDQNGNPVEWKGCVESRPSPHDVQDTAPNAADPATLFVPYFWPDEPDGTGTGYTNNYMADGVASGTTVTVEQRQRRTAKYDPAVRATNVDQTPPDTMGPNKSCPTPIVPLTNDFNRLRQAVSEMREWGNSGTNIAEGLAWGERVLSPEEPYDQGLPWDRDNVQKVVILLTDGENVIFGQNTQTSGPTTHNRSDYSSVGYLSQRRLGTDSPNAAKDVLLARMREICGRVKAPTPRGDRERMQIFTVTFEIPSNDLRQAFRECASRPDMYYDSPSASRLRSVFETIAMELSNLRLTR